MIEIYRRPPSGSQPESLVPAYSSTVKRAPTQALVMLPHTLSETSGPVFGQDSVKASDADLTAQHAAPPLGQRIVVSGQVLDEGGRPVPHTLVEIWQANAGGRYRHANDSTPAPLDPNFSGGGRCLTDAEGRYRFVTIEPGAYPWRNHYNAWRPRHIHFSLWGPAFITRLVTQMYFPGDPLLPFDPIFNSVADAQARECMVSSLDWDSTVPDIAIGYRFDIVLRGRHATPMDR